ncbi:CGNR zinc finger domain-containing protein [Streptomyces sp. NPDC046821]|uniref:CGNR zinc finger domain-containing protein n=1 Tax=Streptomyces sp. NPDC046821 TaxID=3154702 RepID=UPI0033E1B6A2
MSDISTGAHGTQLALDLALTIRHDGHGGVADDLERAEGLTAWVRERVGALPEAGGFVADVVAVDAVRELRAAVRALFAHAVRPAAPSSADAHRLLSVDEAVLRVNAAAALALAVPVLAWDEGADPVVRQEAQGSALDLIIAALARAAVGFLASDDRERLRACHAPRCVRYFLKEHPRQEWCKPSCGNRARVARHHERHRVQA